MKLCALQPLLVGFLNRTEDLPTALLACRRRGNGQGD